MRETWVFGVRIDNVTMEQALACATEGSAPCFAVTPNALMLDACRREPHLAALLNRATLSLPDGCGVLLAARRCGTPLKERVAGIEFGEALLVRAVERGWRVFLLGGREGVAEAAARRLQARYPGLAICGTQNGYFDGADEVAVRERIASAQPELLFVCLGFPKQEVWIDENLRHLPGVRVAVGLGGSLDVWAGDVRRAPRVLSRIGLEWAWRMLCEPRRLRNLPAILRTVLARRVE